MILGMSVPAFTTLHVVISLIVIGAGVVVVVGLASNHRVPIGAALFLATTLLTIATGLLFHSKAIGPPHIAGVLSLLVLAAAIVALYAQHLARAWRTVCGNTAGGGADLCGHGQVVSQEVSSDRARLRRALGLGPAANGQ